MADDLVSIAIVGRQPLMRLGIKGAVEFSELCFNSEEFSSLVELFECDKFFDVVILFKHMGDDFIYSELEFLQNKTDLSKARIVVLSDVIGSEDWNLIDRGIVDFLLPMKVEIGVASYLFGLFLIQPSIPSAECRKWTFLLSHMFYPDIRDLSKKELKIMSYLQHGTCNKIIAYELNIGLSTVKRHLTSIYKKLNIDGRTNTALEANRQLSVVPWGI